MAAFEKLIRDFPNEKELIVKAREYLPGDLSMGPIPWTDGERLQMTLSLPTGRDIGTMELRADLVEVDGRKVWRVGRRMGGNGHMLSSVDVDPQTFQPLASYWKHTLLGTVSAVFKPGEVEMKREGSEETTKVSPDKVVFDNEEVMHLMRRLPLQVGYKTTLPVITTLGGGVVLPVGIEVPVKESIETPAGKYDCFKIVMNVGQTFWISDDAHRYLVKFEGGGAVSHLASISNRKAGSSVSFRDEARGVTLTAPADWVIHATNNSDKGKTDIHLLDPAANGDHISLSLHATDTLAASVRQSARAWAELEFRENLPESLKDVKVRADSWKTCNFAGRPGISCVADFTASGKPKVLFALYAPGPKTSENVMLACSPEFYDGIKKDVDQIIATYRIAK
jgi:hypothetical protein